MGYVCSVRPRRVHNPPNPFEEAHLDFDFEGLEGDAPTAKLEVFTETAKSALVENDSPDVPFRYGVNPYRGCYHGCAYCYARPFHQYLGWGAGTDFERKIVVKTNVAELLHRELGRRSWKGERIAFSGITDCYQPLEAAYRLTRACLEVCHAYRNPVGLITKSALVRRDTDVLARLARDADATVNLSIPFADDETGRKIEPWASTVSKRFDALRALADAGVPVGVGIAPIIPGLNESHIPEILERAKDAGATSAFMILLRLPREVKDVFHVRIEDVLPEPRVKKIKNAVREMRGGKDNTPELGDRMRGDGPRYDAIEQLFLAHRKRLGLDPREDVWEDTPSTYRRTPGDAKQLSLFDRD